MFTVLKFFVAFLLIMTEILRMSLLLIQYIKKLHHKKQAKNIFIRLYLASMFVLMMIISFGLSLWYTSV